VPRVGFFGKLPARADFVSRRLARDFIDPWDEWLQEAIAASVNELTDAWLETYLTAPIWRFMLGPQVCGELPVVGVLMPSVDQVGRYFPLTLALTLPDCDAPASALLFSGKWFARLEELALSALEEKAEFEAFDGTAASILAPDLGRDATAHRASEPALAWTLLANSDPEPIALDLLDHVLKLALTRYSIWWTMGPNDVDGSLAVTSGLPSPRSFTALLDRQWDRWGWGTR